MLIRRILVSRLGSCRFCTRLAFQFALVSWFFIGAMEVLGIERWVIYVALTVSVVLTALWLAHVAGHTVRDSRSSLKANSVSLARRETIPALVRLFAISLISTVALPGTSRAQDPYCPGGSGSCGSDCDPGNGSTYPCSQNSIPCYGGRTSNGYRFCNCVPTNKC
jgi:hypothetical protein